MDKSIQHFLQSGVENLNKIFIDYDDDPKKIAEMVTGVTKEIVLLGCDMIAECWEKYDSLLHDRKELRPGWVIVRSGDERTVTTGLGDVTYRRTYFRNKGTGKYSYLVDDLIGQEAHDRLTEDAKANILKEAAESSYRKGGEKASVMGTAFSKEAVMDLVHTLKFPETEPLAEKRKVKRLYIDADEDHVSLQYLNEKGDIRDSRKNTYMPRLVYVYEGVEAENDRRRLTGRKTFGGGYEGPDGVTQLWKEVYGYIDASYDEDELETIYVNGDGAAWIKTGAAMHARAEFVLDRFHLGKYILAATSHLPDSGDDARSDIYRCINGLHKKELEGIFEKIIAATGRESKAKAVEASRDYILGNWKGIKASVRGRKTDRELECSAEGHVSHIYSDRMSSRPLGWCRKGADKMARLRVYVDNGSSILELVRFQKQELKAAAGAEDLWLPTSTEILREERKAAKRFGSIYDTRIYSVPYESVKKIAALKGHIWGL